MKIPSTYRPSPAMAVAMLALFVAIGGTAMALPGRNQVNSGDVKNETLLTQDLKNGQAVQSSDVINDSLQTEDYGPGSVQTSDIGSFVVTAGKIGNDAVLNQHLGTSAVASDNIVSFGVGSDELTTIDAVGDATPHDFGNQDEGNNDYEYGSSTADCPAGSDVIAGGGSWVGAGNGGGGGDELQAITRSAQGSGESWTATAVSDVDDQDFTAVAYCLEAGVSSP